MFFTAVFVLLDRRVGRVLVALGQRPLVFDVLLVAFEVRVGVAPPLAFLVVGAELARMLGLVAAVGLGKDHGTGCGRGGSVGAGVWAALAFATIARAMKSAGRWISL
jgi:hypothetical protein